MNAPDVPPPSPESSKDEPTPPSEAETGAAPLRQFRRLSRWWVDHPRTVFSLILGGFILMAMVIVVLNLRGATRRPRAWVAASDAKTAVTQAIVYAKDKGVYPTSLKVLRDSGYANVPDTDRWDRPFVLAPILSEGRKPRKEDDVYVYSQGACGTGTYEPTRWRKRSDGSLDTGKCGAAGYSSVHERFIGQDP